MKWNLWNEKDEWIGTATGASEAEAIKNGQDLGAVGVVKATPREENEGKGMH